MPAADVALPLRVGARTVLTLRRRLVRRALTLAEALDGKLPTLPPLQPGDQGYLVTSLPAALAGPLAAGALGLRAFVRQRYARHYADLGVGHDEWLAGLSAKSRSSLRRKVRRLAERSGGALDLRACRDETEVGDFHRAARAVSATTYQERLLDAGLPDGPEAVARMRALARAGRARGWLLFVDGAPISYLWCPADDGTLLYAYLGYDPAFAEFSPGTVLQLEAMRELRAEGRFRRFDFTEGDGQHKRLFATGAVSCVDLMLLRPTAGNLAAAAALALFDGAAAVAKRLLVAAGAAGAARRLRR